MILDVYITKESATHITSPLPRNAGSMDGVTSWPTTTPLSSTISMVTSDGLAKSGPQLITNTEALDAQVSMPGFSILSPPDTLSMDPSMSATLPSTSLSRGLASTTPGIPARYSRNSS